MKTFEEFDFKRKIDPFEETYKYLHMDKLEIKFYLLDEYEIIRSNTLYFFYKNELLFKYNSSTIYLISKIFNDVTKYFIYDDLLIRNFFKIINDKIERVDIIDFEIRKFIEEFFDKYL